MACRLLMDKKYEITLSNAQAKKRLLDGFKIGSSTILPIFLRIYMEWEMFPPQLITVQPAQRCHGRHNQKVTGQKTDQRGNISYAMFIIC